MRLVRTANKVLQQIAIPLIFLSGHAGSASASALPGSNCSTGGVQEPVSLVCGSNFVESMASTSTLFPAPGVGGAVTLTYFYEVLDPLNRTIDASLTYLLYGQAYTDLSNPGFEYGSEGDASILVEYAGGSYSDSLRAFTSATQGFVAGGGNVLHAAFLVNTNTTYQVTLSTSSAVIANGAAEAFVDPSISIDSSLYAGDIVIVSDGISNSFDPGNFSRLFAVPEPNALALAAAGVFAFLRLRRSHSNRRKFAERFS